MIGAIIAGVEVAFLVGDYLYHRWNKPPPPPPQPFNITPSDPGSPLPLLYGTVRVTQPVLSWYGNTSSVPTDADGGVVDPSDAVKYTYLSDLMFIVGIPPEGGDCYPAGDIDKATGSLWYGDSKINFPIFFGRPGSSQGWLGPGAGATVAAQPIGGNVLFYGGGPTQDLSMESQFMARIVLSQPGQATITPSYRGQAICMLYGGIDTGWDHGSSPTIAAYQPAVTAVPSLDSSFGPSLMIGQEMNGVDVIYDLLTGTHGKPGIDPSRIDLASFIIAARTLEEEGNGYSRATSDGQAVRDVVNEVLAQADGIIHDKAADGKIRIKLVRADYDPATVPEINVDNCSGFESPTLGSFDDAPSLVRLSYMNRANNYQTDTVLANDPGIAVGQEVPTHLDVSYPGCCTPELAQALADREQIAQCRPIAKLTAVVDRTLVAIVPGDVVAVTWPDCGWDRILFRVATVNRGTLMDSSIRLGLIQEYFQPYRGSTSGSRTGTSFPHSPALG